MRDVTITAGGGARICNPSASVLAIMRRAVFLLLCCVQLPGRGDDSIPDKVDCMTAEYFAPTATLEFQRTYRNNKHELIAVFELVNYEAKAGLAIPLERGTSEPEVSFLAALVEFKDLNDMWEVLFDHRPPATYVWEPVVKVVKTDERLQFRYPLDRIERQMLKYGGMEFRLKLFTDKQKSCLLSFPFKAVPEPIPATGLLPVPHPPVRTNKGP